MDDVNIIICCELRERVTMGIVGLGPAAFPRDYNGRGDIYQIVREKR